MLRRVTYKEGGWTHPTRAEHIRRMEQYGRFMRQEEESLVGRVAKLACVYIKPFIRPAELASTWGKAVLQILQEYGVDKTKATDRKKWEEELATKMGRGANEAKWHDAREKAKGRQSNTEEWAKMERRWLDELEPTQRTVMLRLRTGGHFLGDMMEKIGRKAQSACVSCLRKKHVDQETAQHVLQECPEYS